jgi:hypothetical protein
MGVTPSNRRNQDDVALRRIQRDREAAASELVPDRDSARFQARMARLDEERQARSRARHRRRTRPVANPIRHRPQPWNRLPADRSLTGFDSLNWCPWASFTDWSQGRLLGPEPGRGHVPPFLEDSARSPGGNNLPCRPLRQPQLFVSPRRRTAGQVPARGVTADSRHPHDDP